MKKIVLCAILTFANSFAAEPKKDAQAVQVKELHLPNEIRGAILFHYHAQVISFFKRNPEYIGAPNKESNYTPLMYVMTLGTDLEYCDDCAHVVDFVLNAKNNNVNHAVHHKGSAITALDIATRNISDKRFGSVLNSLVDAGLDVTLPCGNYPNAYQAFQSDVFGRYDRFLPQIKELEAATKKEKK